MVIKLNRRQGCGTIAVQMPDLHIPSPNAYRNSTYKNMELTMQVFLLSAIGDKITARPGKGSCFQQQELAH
jgi:hypothetical protein